MREVWDWEAWTEQLVGDAGEDLSGVFTNVKVHTLRVTQVKWATDWETRAFCDLALHLLYQHHLTDTSSPSLSHELKLFKNLGPEDLMRHASRLIPDAHQADRLDRQRWLDTWRHQAAFLEDLIAYLFRPGVVLRRVRQVQEELVAMAPALTLGDLIREGTEAELQSTLASPVVGLQTFIQAALPRQPRIQQAIHAIETTALDEWARLYGAVFPAYGLSLRPGASWLDMSRLFDALIEGVLLKARTLDHIPCLANGDNLLAGGIFALLPALCDIPAAQVDSLTVCEPIRWKPDPRT
ncbi:hypothetical protein [Streptomyces sp. NPDC048309]|uniref:hypothetical protein n=1 Tax=Streptomyces sp. NPDC048309 TaxID=3154618 RepID=UPI0034087C71